MAGVVGAGIAGFEEAIGPSSCVMGPFSVGKYDAQQLVAYLLKTASSNGKDSSNSSGAEKLASKFSTLKSATVYYPYTSSTNTPAAGQQRVEVDPKGVLVNSNLPSVTLLGGWGCGEHMLDAWAPFLASHGFVVLTIGLKYPFAANTEERARAALAASRALVEFCDKNENTPLCGKLDKNNRALIGFSMGGGGVQTAANFEDNGLKCVISFCPDLVLEKGFASPCPPELGIQKVPVLTICGSHDTTSPAKKHAWEMYRRTKGPPKLIFEVRGGGHYVANGPGGACIGTQSEPANPLYLFGWLLNTFYVGCAVGCKGDCGLWPRKYWCECPCPGTLNGPSGYAAPRGSPSAPPHGAVGGVALAWLQLYLFGDESARAKLRKAPAIASNYEHEGVLNVTNNMTEPPTMEHMRGQM